MTTRPVRACEVTHEWVLMLSIRWAPGDLGNPASTVRRGPHSVLPHWRNPRRALGWPSSLRRMLVLLGTACFLRSVAVVGAMPPSVPSPASVGSCHARGNDHRRPRQDAPARHGYGRFTQHHQGVCRPFAIGALGGWPPRRRSAYLPWCARSRAGVPGTLSFSGQVGGRPLVVIAHPDGLRTTLEPVASQLRVGQRSQPGK